MDNNQLCLIEKKNEGLKYTICNKLLDSPKKKKINNDFYILNFIKNDFIFKKKNLELYKVR